MNVQHKTAILIYAGRSLVQRSYVMHMQLMSFCVREPLGPFYNRP